MSNAAPPLFSSILLIEDDAAFRRRLARSLRDQGLTVFEATSAEEGISVAQEYCPEAAVIDIRMPGQGGLWGVEQLLKLAPAMKIVVLTGFGAITTAIDAVRLGAVNYLTKPASVDALLAAFSAQPKTTQDTESIPSLESVQSEYINRVVGEFSGNISRAARALGLHRRSLQRILKARDEG
jgi:two-component system response regulator RegA